MFMWDRKKVMIRELLFPPRINYLVFIGLVSVYIFDLNGSRKTIPLICPWTMEI